MSEHLEESRKFYEDLVAAYQRGEIKNSLRDDQNMIVFSLMRNAWDRGYIAGKFAGLKDGLDAAVGVKNE